MSAIGENILIEAEVNSSSNVAQTPSTPTDNSQDSSKQSDGGNDDRNQDDTLNPKKMKSPVWEHFLKKIEGGDAKAERKYCKKELGANSRNGITHLHNRFATCKKRSRNNLRQEVLTKNWIKGGDEKQLSSYAFQRGIQSRTWKDEGAVYAMDRIRSVCYSLLSEYQSKIFIDRQNESSESCHIHVGKFDDSLSDYDAFVSKKRCRTSYIKTKVDHYLEEEVLPTVADFDILIWWKQNGVKYPTLQAIARDLLVISVSTVASESAFSCSGRLVSPHRNRIHPKTLEALMCAQNWLWAAENGASDNYATIYDDIDGDASVQTGVSGLESISVGD